LDNVEIYHEAPLKEGGQIAWAVRKESTELRESLSSFARRHQKGSLMGNILFARYFDDTDWITGVRSDAPSQLETMRSLSQKYADEYDFDWLLLAAVAHQESKLDQDTRSRAGAVGVFQIKPEVASKEVGIDNVHSLEENIQAGIRYLNHIRDTYLDESDLTEVQKNDFMLASYNAGPTRIRQLRKKAAENGYDGNTWFGNVERFAPRETRTYVANINRLYYAFKLGWLLRDTRQEQIEEMKK
jgi:membrane-bound lytic murein transglycosylase MltF